MKLSRECQILIGQHIQQNARPTATQKDIDKAFDVFKKSVINILEEFQLEIEATKYLPFANKLSFSLKNAKEQPVYLSTNEVHLIQQLADKIFHTDLWIQEHQSLKKSKLSSLHPTIFLKELRGPVSISGVIDLKESTLNPMRARL